MNDTISPDAETGLRADQVAQKRAQGRQNVLDDRATKSTAQILKDNVCTLFNLFNLLIAAALALVGAWSNLLFLLVVALNTLIGIAQEVHAKRLVEKLSLLSLPTARVIRDGAPAEVPTQDLVEEDVIELEAGRQVCADAVLLTGAAEVNESLLTGESDPVRRSAGEHLLSGSFVVSGRCRARVEHVGRENYAARIAQEAKALRGVRSELLTSMCKVTRFTGYWIPFLGVLLFLEALFLRGDPVQDAVVATSAGLLGMLPKGLVLLTSVSLAAGIIALSRRRVLVQELYALETLAHVDTLCLDKTGTLTQGAMRVEEVRLTALDRAEAFEEKMGAFLHASQDNNATFQALQARFPARSAPEPLERIPFSSERKWSAVRFADYTFVVGAPKRLAGPEEQAEKRAAFRAGRRVLLAGLADGPVRADGPLPRVRVLASLFLADPIRPDAAETLAYFQREGVQLKLLSGDNPEAVAALAAQAGFPEAERYLDMTGVTSEADIERAAQTHSIFGRVSPAQKKQLVQALQRHGHGQRRRAAGGAGRAAGLGLRRPAGRAAPGPPRGQQHHAGRRHLPGQDHLLRAAVGRLHPVQPPVSAGPHPGHVDGPGHRGIPLVPAVLCPGRAEDLRPVSAHRAAAGAAQRRRDPGLLPGEPRAAAGAPDPPGAGADAVLPAGGRGRNSGGLQGLLAPQRPARPTLRRDGGGILRRGRPAARRAAHRAARRAGRAAAAQPGAAELPRGARGHGPAAPRRRAAKKGDVSSMTIQKRLFLSNLLMLVIPALLAVLVLMAALFLFASAALPDSNLDLLSRHELEEARRELAAGAADWLAQTDPAQREERAAQLAQAAEARQMALRIERDGAAVGEFGASAPAESARLRAALAALEGVGTVSDGQTDLFGAQISVGGAAYRVEIWNPVVSVESRTIRVQAVVFGFFVVVIVLFLVFLTNRFLIRFVFRHISEPLTTLAEGVRQIRDGNLDHRIAHAQRDEFQPVCEAFNEMDDRLRASVEQSQREEEGRKELLASISHDVRSPLTSIRAYVEGLLDGVADTPEKQRAYLSIVQKNAVEIDDLVKKLFQFSKMDMGEFPYSPERLCVAEEVADFLQASAEAYAGRGLRVACRGIPPDAYIEADPTYFRSILTNLLDNSAKYRKGEQGRAADPPVRGRRRPRRARGGAAQAVRRVLSQRPVPEKSRPGQRPGGGLRMTIHIPLAGRD